MEAIILAGGYGTRLRSVVSHVPKAMAPVAGRPFLELLLSSLRAKGITRVVLSLGYMADCILSHFRNRDVGVDLVYEVETSPLGTGGALAAALGRLQADHAIVLNGDTYLEFDLPRLEAMWPGDRTPVVVMRVVPDTERFGRLECVGGRVKEFAGKGIKGEGLINAGCYLLPRDLFRESPLPQVFSFENDFLAKRAAYSLRAFVADGCFVDIGVPEDYYRAQADLADVFGK